jgi:hypothetical protein
MDAGPKFKQQEAECDVAHNNTGHYHGDYIIQGLQYSRMHKVVSYTATYLKIQIQVTTYEHGCY